MSYLFVYGTLMRNQENHTIIENEEFLGEFTTMDKFTMYINEYIPFVVEDKNYHINGELYKISDFVQKQIDFLEKGYEKKYIYLNGFNTNALIYVYNGFISPNWYKCIDGNYLHYI